MPRKFLFMLHKLQTKQQRQKNTGVLQLWEFPFVLLKDEHSLEIEWPQCE